MCGTKSCAILGHSPMIAIVMYSSGLRVSEAVRLRVGDIHRDTMQISVTEGKGGKDRRAVLSEQCLRELEQYWRQYRPKDYFFPSKDYAPTPGV